jgi:hypothetical protein
VVVGHVSELGSIHSGLTEPGYRADIKWHDDEFKDAYKNLGITVFIRGRNKTMINVRIV